MSRFLTTIKNKSPNHYYINKISNNLKFINSTTTTNYNIPQNRFFTSKSKVRKGNKYSQYIHTPNKNISLTNSLDLKDVSVFSNIKPLAPLKNEIQTEIDQNDDNILESNMNINNSNNNDNNNDNNNFDNSLAHNKRNDDNDIYNELYNNDKDIDYNIDNSIDNNIYNSLDNNLENNNIDNDNNKTDEIKNEIYLNPKQYVVYKQLTVVRVKDSSHRDDVIRQLRIAIPQSGWKINKENPNLVMGNVSPEVYRDFITNQTKFNKHNIKVLNSSKQPFVGFSKQILPNSIEVDEDSLQAWVEKASEFIISNYRACKWKRWRIHLLTPTSALQPNNKRVQIESLILKYLKKKHYKELSHSYSLKASGNRPIGLFDDEALVQIMFVGANKGYISVMTPTMYQYYKKMTSIYPSGTAKPLLGVLSQYMYKLFSPQLSQSHIHIQAIKNFMNPSQSLEKEYIKSMSFDSIVSTFLPSRSFIKLVELFTRFPKFPSMRINDTVCDLGSSPGGWTLFSLLQGCCVVSIDKAPLDHRFIDENNDQDHLIFIRESAFEFDPVGTFDWLIIDMKVPPMKTLKLLEKWLEKNHCNNFIVNLKFDRNSFDLHECELFIQRNILPLTGYINSHCLDSNGDKELTLFGTKKSIINTIGDVNSLTPTINEE
ncbi:hypothetical protein DICPUDRAFT_27527 [Dictyostelium purpureum]|uniref:Ribosomal RNA methyltransferase FtsJ domain-containing protein n=1 Tax=Dictyostelium purpureum TaxID=5786 RepID=F0ZAA0_DICPU|nr:uncharacterized protein DICPUDRAFT_27527 [Dictyostelium purpureum]EGC39090.1 hypothetical protein DICPUDRAFT_27527 [Dictyostelium purpureum]|eukprot:XP_003284342.1 hypothetical protein DICPUDRAFT_27527 [Dictyostelium purpureum]